MINLLPPDQKKQIRAGKSNVLLLRYCVASVALAGVLGTIIVFTYFTMQHSRSTAESALEAGQRQSAQYANIQQAASEFSNNLAIAKTVLDKEVRYTSAAINLAQALPAGIVLDSLQLDSQTFDKPITLSARAKSYDDAVRLKTTFEQSSLFRDPHLISVSQSEGNSDYPVSVSISVIISSEIAKP